MYENSLTYKMGSPFPSFTLKVCIFAPLFMSYSKILPFISIRVRTSVPQLRFGGVRTRTYAFIFYRTKISYIYEKKYQHPILTYEGLKRLSLDQGPEDPPPNPTCLLIGLTSESNGWTASADLKRFWGPVARVQH